MTFCLVVTGNKQSARGTNNPFRKTAVSMLMQALHQRLVKLQFPVLVEWIRLCRVRALLHLNSGHGRPQAAIRYAKRAREVVPSSRAVKRASWSNFLNCIVSGGLCFPKLVPRPTAEMAVTLLVATYHRRMLLGVAKAVPGEPETDPRSFGLKLDDPDGHLHLEQVLLGPGEAVISRVSSTSYSGRMRDDDHFTFVFQRAGRYDLKIAGNDFGMSPGSLLAFRPNERLTRVRAARNGTRTAVTLQVPVARMADLARVVETSTNAVFPRDGIAFHGTAGRSLAAILPQLADDLLVRPSAAPPPRLTQEIRFLIEDVLCEALGVTIEQHSSRRIFPAFHRVRQAEELMHAHSDEPVSIRDIAQFLGVSVRSLQLAFAETHDGLTPRGVLNRIRLEKARARLLAADGDAQVTTVAMDSGLFHLGRFSQAYARAFGEKPSETLMRKRA
jgi:AraC-like DNA-binding protein